MGKLTWTKPFHVTDNFRVLDGADLGNIQSDITDQVNGSLTNFNISLNASIQESKLSFNTSTGHNHNGVNSRLVSAVANDPFGREGLQISRTDNNTLSVGAGSIVIDNTVFTTTAATSIDNDGGTGHGTADDASSFVFVYAYDNSGSLAFSVSHNHPNTNDFAGNTGGGIFRFRDFSGSVRRCIGGIYNDSSQNFEAGTEINFDGSNIATGKVDIGIGESTRVVTTIWTPRFVRSINHDGQNYVAGNSIGVNEATKSFLDQYSLPMHTNVDFSITSITVQPSHHVSAITEQSASCPGSFTITPDGNSGSDEYYWIATTDQFSARAF